MEEMESVVESVETTQEPVVESVETKEEAAPTSVLDELKAKAEKVIDENKESAVEEQPKEEVKAAEKPAYTPDFKVTAYGKEYVIPELFRSIIKDKESENKVREVFAKANAFEDAHEKYTKLNEYHKPLAQEHTALKNDISRLSRFVKLRDYDSFFESLAIKEEDLKAWMYEKLQRSQLPPEQKAVYDREQALRRELYSKEESQAQLQADLESRNAEYVETQTKVLQTQINEALSKPDVKAIVEKVDSLQGANFFYNQIIEEGSKRFEKTGEVVPADQLVQELVGMYGKFVQASQPQPQAAPVRGQATVKAQQQNPVIPNMGGSTSSPIKKKITTFNDLQKAREEMLQERI